MRRLAQRSSAADATSGLDTANVNARTRAADGWRVSRRGTALGLVAMLVSVAPSACGSSRGLAPGTASVVSAPVRIARTRLGTIGYRVVGTGPPLVLIMGYSGTMEVWDPRLVHALARHNRVVMFDNAGIGRTQALPGEHTGTLTIDAMAGQTSALIDTLGLGSPDVLGWSRYRADAPCPPDQLPRRDGSRPMWPMLRYMMPPSGAWTRQMITHAHLGR